LSRTPIANVLGASGMPHRSLASRSWSATLRWITGQRIDASGGRRI
jgi:hypothetical protein